MNGRSQCPTYLVFLLRMWQVQPATASSSAVWRCSLEDPDTHQERGFADLPSLVSYLRTATNTTFIPLWQTSPGSDKK